MTTARPRKSTPPESAHGDRAAKAANAAWAVVRERGTYRSSLARLQADRRAGLVCDEEYFAQESRP